MAHPKKDFRHPQPQTCKQTHTQESGDAGLSSNMEHKYSDNYEENDWPVADQGSFVRPIPEDEVGISEFPAITAKTPHPSLFRPESLQVSAEKGLLKPSIVAVVQKNKLPPLRSLSDNSKEEEGAEVLPGTTAITEVDAKEEGSSMDPKVERRRNGICYRKRTAGKNLKFYLLCLVVWFPACEGPAVGTQPAADTSAHTPIEEAKCFTCMDKERCPNLIRIFDHTDDTRLYQRGLNKTFPPCSEISPLTPKSCAVCRTQSVIIIYCSKDVSKFDAEDNGSHITNITKGCKPQHTFDHEQNGVPSHDSAGHLHIGLMCGVGLFSIVVGALVVYSC